MDSVTLRAVLDADPRPTLVLDLAAADTATRFHPAFVNDSFKQDKAAFALVIGNDSDALRLRRWATRPALAAGSMEEDLVLETARGYSWYSYTIQDRWRVLQAIHHVNAPTLPDLATPPEDDTFNHESLLISSLHVPRDASSETPNVYLGLSDDAIASIDGLDRHITAITSVDWAATSLGPIATWPDDILQLVHLILLDPLPQALFLGDEMALLYNLAYAEFAGDRHPAILGQDIFTAWPEAIELNISIISYIDAHGKPYIMNDFEISLDRRGYLEEVHLRWTTIPIKGPTRGYLCTAADETDLKISARRKALLTRISNACRGIRDLSQFWSAVLETLATNAKDFPFAFVYSKSHTQDGIYTLECALDTDDPLSVLPATMNLNADQGQFVQACRQAEAGPDPSFITEIEGSIPPSIAALSEKRGSFDRCKQGMVCPIRRASDNQVLGLLAFGLHTRKTFKADDRAFVQFMMRCLGDLATNTINAQETDHLAKQTASRHQTLIQALATTTLEASQMTEKFHHIVRTMEMVDVGIFEFDMNGRLIQANEAFFKMSSHTRTSKTKEFIWKDYVHPEDLAMTSENWERVAAGGTANFEFRYKNPPPDTPQEELEYGMDGWWVMAAVVPVVDQKTGMVKSISGCVTDIMPVKRSQMQALQRTEALEKLRESEQKFNRFAENALCPIFVIDTDRKLKYHNDAYRELVDAEASQDIIGTALDGLIFADDLPSVLDLWDTGSRTHSCVQLNCRIRRQWNGPDGAHGPKWVIVSAYPETDQSGFITGWIGVAFDISHLKWAEKVQQDRVQEAFEAKRQQENFIDMTSHEIRNPLGAVVHCADSILASLVDLDGVIKNPAWRMEDEQRRRVSAIHDSAIDAVNTIISCSNHQRRIVDDVLTWSKLNSDLLRIIPSVVRPTAILGDIRNMFEIDAEKVGVTLIVRQERDSNAVSSAEWVMLDTGRLMQVLINLVTNAIKFTREESERKVTITMGTTALKPSLDRMPIDFVPSSNKRPVQQSEAEWGDGQPLYLYFLVEDTGCGLSPDEKGKIFARFSQGSPRTHTKYGGSGLGLFISRELVELQCGEIGFASQAGSGSTFGFFIKAQTAEAPFPQSTPTIRATRVNSAGSSTAHRFTILIVEDNVVNQAVLSKQLRKLGHDVHVASHGKEALDFLRTTKNWRGPADPPRPTDGYVMDGDASIGEPEHGEPTQDTPDCEIELDVVLMDVEMPVMDGLTCAARIRGYQDDGMIQGHLPIIAVSANARTGQVNQAMACGMDDAISKPFRIVDLMPKIERLVG